MKEEKNLASSKDEECSQFQENQSKTISSEFLEEYKKIIQPYLPLESAQIKEALSSSGIVVSSKYENIVIDIFQFRNHQSVMLKVHIGFYIFQISILNIGRKNFYEFERKQLGSGSFGSIFEVLHDSQAYAIKKITLGKKQKSSFLNTILEFCFFKIASVLKIGPKLFSLFGYDIIYYDGSIEFSMQKCIQSPQKIYTKYEDLMKGLRTIHQINMIHSDIKPDNISYSPFFEKWVFLDFGMSQIVQQKLGEKTQTKFRGTYSFCSEQMKKTYFSEDRKFVDLYFNDLACLENSLIFEKNIIPEKQKPQQIVERIMEIKAKDNEESCWYKIIDYFKCKFYIFRQIPEQLNKILQQNSQIMKALSQERNLIEQCEEQISQLLQKQKENQKENDQEDNQLQQFINSNFNFQKRYLKMKKSQIKRKEFQRKVQLQKYLFQNVKKCNQDFFLRNFIFYLAQCQMKTPKDQVSETVEKIQNLIEQITENLKPPLLVNEPESLFPKFFNILYKAQQSSENYHQLTAFYLFFHYTEGITRIFRKKRSKYDQLSKEEAFSQFLSDLIFIHGQCQETFLETLEIIKKFDVGENKAMQKKKQFLLLFGNQLLEGENQTMETILTLLKKHQKKLNEMNLGEVSRIYLHLTYKKKQNLEIKAQENNWIKTTLMSTKVFLSACTRLSHFGSYVQLIRQSPVFKLFPSMQKISLKFNKCQDESVKKYSKDLLSIEKENKVFYALILFKLVQSSVNFKRAELLEKFMDDIDNLIQKVKMVMIQNYFSFFPFILNFCMFLDDNLHYIPQRMKQNLRYIIKKYKNLQNIQIIQSVRIKAIGYRFDNNIPGIVSLVSSFFNDELTPKNAFIIKKMRFLSWLGLLLEKNHQKQKKLLNQADQIYLKFWYDLKNLPKRGYYWSLGHYLHKKIFLLLVKKNFDEEIYFFLYYLCQHISERRMSVDNFPFQFFYHTMMKDMSHQTRTTLINKAYKTENYTTIRKNYTFANITLMFRSLMPIFVPHVSRKFVTLSMIGASLSTFYDKRKIQKILLTTFNSYFSPRRTLRKAFIVSRKVYYVMENQEYFEKMERAIKRKMKLKKKGRDKSIEYNLFQKIRKIRRNFCSKKEVYFLQID